MKKNTLKQIGKIGLLTLTISTTISLLGDQDYHIRYGIPTSTEAFQTMLEEVEEKTPVTTDSNDKARVFYYVMENPNLDESEKAMIYDLANMLKENPNLNPDLAGIALKDLRISYGESNNQYQDSTIAIYSSYDNTIHVFRRKEEVPSKIMVHEIIHCIYNNHGTFHLPDYFVEGTTQLLTDEYASETPFLEESSYPYETIMVKLLCEMVGSDKVLETFTDGNLGHIEKELEKKISKEETKTFMESVNNVFQEYKQERRVGKEQLEKMLSYTDYFFINKYKKEPTREKIEYYYYLRELLKEMAEEDSYTHYLNYIEEKGIYTIPYFSTELKNTYQTPEKVYLEKPLLKRIASYTNTQQNV